MRFCLEFCKLLKKITKNLSDSIPKNYTDLFLLILNSKQENSF